MTIWLSSLTTPEIYPLICLKGYLTISSTYFGMAANSSNVGWSTGLHFSRRQPEILSAEITTVSSRFNQLWLSNQATFTFAPWLGSSMGGYLILCCLNDTGNSWSVFQVLHYYLLTQIRYCIPGMCLTAECQLFSVFECQLFLRRS